MNSRQRRKERRVITIAFKAFATAANNCGEKIGAMAAVVKFLGRIP